jgi:hypothetical protein
MVFIVDILNVYTAVSVSDRSMLKQESRMRDEPLSVGHVLVSFFCSLVDNLSLHFKSQFNVMFFFDDIEF